MALQGVGYKSTRLRTKGIDLSHHHEMVEHKAKNKDLLQKVKVQKNKSKGQTKLCKHQHIMNK